MGTLYVTRADARVEKHYEQLLVTHLDEVLLAVPLTQVSGVVLVGQAGITTAALHALLRQGAGLSLLSRSGGLLGQLHPPGLADPALLRRQIMRGEDPEFCLNFARALIGGKLRNCRSLAHRWARRVAEISALLPRLDQAVSDAAGAPNLASLRGVEGAGARAYFRALYLALPPDFPFAKRTRRPPLDPVSALLSFSYSLLTADLISALRMARLEAAIGFFHSEKPGRPALALDLMEEFRPLIADQVTVALLNRHVLRPQDFVAAPEGGIRLSPRGLRRTLRAYSHRLNTQAFHPRAGRPLSYQKIMEVQARHLRRVIEGEQDGYRPFRVR